MSHLKFWRNADPVSSDILLCADCSMTVKDTARGIPLRTTHQCNAMLKRLLKEKQETISTIRTSLLSTPITDNTEAQALGQSILNLINVAHPELALV